MTATAKHLPGDKGPALIARLVAPITGRKSIRKLHARQNSFLQKHLVAVKPVHGSTLLKNSLLLMQQRRQKELRFYHKRLRIRLPGTKMTRKRRRKGGLVTFVRNALKRPKTLYGQQNLLLPSATSYVAAASPV